MQEKQPQKKSTENFTDDAWNNRHPEPKVLQVEEIAKMIMECPVHRDCYFTAAQAIHDALYGGTK